MVHAILATNSSSNNVPLPLPLAIASRFLANLFTELEVKPDHIGRRPLTVRPPDVGVQFSR